MDSPLLDLVRLPHCLYSSSFGFMRPFSPSKLITVSSYSLSPWDPGLERTPPSPTRTKFCSKAFRQVIEMPPPPLQSTGTGKGPFPSFSPSPSPFSFQEPKWTRLIPVPIQWKVRLQFVKKDILSRNLSPCSSCSTRISPLFPHSFFL